MGQYAPHTWHAVLGYSGYGGPSQQTPHRSRAAAERRLRRMVAPYRAVMPYRVDGTAGTGYDISVAAGAYAYAYTECCNDDECEVGWS